MRLRESLFCAALMSIALVTTNASAPTVPGEECIPDFSVDGPSGGEAKTAAGKLGRKEGVEDALRRLGVHAAAGVGDAQRDVGAGWQLGAQGRRGQKGLVQPAAAGADGDGGPARSR